VEIKHSDGQIQLLERKINQCWNYTGFSIAMIRLPEATRGYQLVPWNVYFGRKFFSLSTSIHGMIDDSH
jgi:hypothetical protein